MIKNISIKTGSNFSQRTWKTQFMIFWNSYFRGSTTLTSHGLRNSSKTSQTRTLPTEQHHLCCYCSTTTTSEHYSDNSHSNRNNIYMYTYQNATTHRPRRSNEHKAHAVTPQLRHWTSASTHLDHGPNSTSSITSENINIFGISGANGLTRAAYEHPKEDVTFDLIFQQPHPN